MVLHSASGQLPSARGGRGNPSVRQTKVVDCQTDSRNVSAYGERGSTTPFAVEGPRILIFRVYRAVWLHIAPQRCCFEADQQPIWSCNGTKAPQMGKLSRQIEAKSAA